MSTILTWVIILVVMSLLMYFLFFRRAQGGGGGPSAAQFGKARARTLAETGRTVTFADVPGPTRKRKSWPRWWTFSASPPSTPSWGRGIPKGVLLVGPPAPQDPPGPGRGRGGRLPVPVHLRL